MALDDDVTLDDLYILAADELEITEINEPLSAEDKDKFVTRYPLVYGMLEGRGLVQWGINDPIPIRYADAVAALLAERCARTFKTEYVAPWAIPELVRQVKPDYTYDETFFMEF